MTLSCLSLSDSQIKWYRAHPVLLMVSGGPDSVCLFRLFVEWRKTSGINFEVLHVNHHLRGRESGAEARFVRSLCKKYNVVLHLKKLGRVPQVGNKQDFYRKARIDFAFGVARERRLKCVATAHHADDALETLCMRVSRGAGLSGLCGIREWIRRTREGQILHWVRPLLPLLKSQILKELAAWQQPYRVDSSNLEPWYFRNRVRLNLKDFSLSDKELHRCLHLSKLLQQIDDYLRLRCAELWKHYGKHVPEGVWSAWPRELQFRYFARAMQMCGFGHQVCQKHLELILHKQPKLVLGRACCEWVGKTRHGGSRELLFRRLPD